MKDGKEHSHFRIVENARAVDARVVPRRLLYLGHINSSQAAAWCKCIDVLEAGVLLARTLAAFPEDRCVAECADGAVVFRLRLSALCLQRPCQ